MEIWRLCQWRIDSRSVLAWDFFQPAESRQAEQVIKPLAQTSKLRTPDPPPGLPGASRRRAAELDEHIKMPS